MSVVTPASEPALPDAPRGAKTANLYNNVSKSNKMVPGPGHNLFTTYPPHARFAVRNTRYNDSIMLLAEAMFVIALA